MKNPNGYGTVVNLGSKRRKPYGLRYTTNCKLDKGKKKVKQEYKYLNYYEKRKEALADQGKFQDMRDQGYPVEFIVNFYQKSGMRFPENYMTVDITEAKVKKKMVPTLKEVYDKFIEYKKSLNSAPANSTLARYKFAVNKIKDVWDVPLDVLSVEDLQTVLAGYKDASPHIVSNIQTILTHIYNYAVKFQFIKKEDNIVEYLDFESKEVVKKESKHKPVPVNIINKLWDNMNTYGVDIFLILMYTGCRPEELLDMETKNVFIEDRYMVGGVKTDAGKNRIIPLHEKIVPLIRRIYDSEEEYLIRTLHGKKFNYSNYYCTFNKMVKELGIEEYTMYDARHTVTTELDNQNVSDHLIKLILGHAIKDVTKKHYTHKTIEQLVEAINKIQY